MYERCIVYLICIKKINHVVNQSFQKYRKRRGVSFQLLHISSSWARIRLHIKIWLSRLPATSFFWFGFHYCCDCDRLKTESTPSILTKDLVGVWHFNCCKIWSPVSVIWHNYIPVNPPDLGRCLMVSARKLYLNYTNK